MTEDEWKLTEKLMASYHAMMILREAVHTAVSAFTEPAHAHNKEVANIRRYLELSLELSDASVNHV